MIKEFNLKDYFVMNNHSIGISTFLSCNFYDTKYKEIIITDYDINNEENLKPKGLSLLSYKRKGYRATMYVSNMILQHEGLLFNEIIEDFYNENKKK